MPIVPAYPGMPGLGTEQRASQRAVFRGNIEKYFPGGRVIDGTKSRDPGNTPVGTLRAGLLMGRVTTGGKYAPSYIGVNQNAYTSGGTTITVTAAQAVEIVRRVGATGNLLYIGPPAAAGTVAVLGPIAYSAVNTSNGQITTATLGANLIAGAFVAANDGSQIPVSFLPDGFGYNCLDSGGNSQDIPYYAFPVDGDVQSDKLLPVWPSDTSLQAYIVSNLRSNLDLRFSHLITG